MSSKFLYLNQKICCIVAGPSHKFVSDYSCNVSSVLPACGSFCGSFCDAFSILDCTVVLRHTTSRLTDYRNHDHINLTPIRRTFRIFGLITRNSKLPNFGSFFRKPKTPGITLPASFAKSNPSQNLPQPELSCLNSTRRWKYRILIKC
jgi:hypothetical protein